MKHSQMQLYLRHQSEQGHSPRDTAAAAKNHPCKSDTSGGTRLQNTPRLKLGKSLPEQVSVCSTALPWSTNLQFFISCLEL